MKEPEGYGSHPRPVNAALNQWLFNISTVDQALELLMQRELKVSGGDRLGKTINIFARNHNHAGTICSTLRASYPTTKGKFAQSSIA